MIHLGLVALTLLALLALVWPLLRRRAGDPAATSALEVYRDQLKEIERDRDRGLIGEQEARAARTEIERRLLKAAEAAETDVPSWTRGGPLALAVTLVAVPAGALWFYYAELGSPHLPDMPLANREPAETPQRAEIESMVAGLESRLEESPDDLEGWLMLGRSRSVLGELDAAVDAYRRARELNADHPEMLGGLAETLVRRAGGVVTPEARRLFERLAEAEPRDPRAGFYLGLAAAQAADYHEALRHWRRLLARTPEDAPWRGRLEAQIRDAAEEIGVDGEAIIAEAEAARTQASAARSGDASDDASGDAREGRAAPTTGEDIAALPPEERDRRIRGMVESLAARLEAEGGSPEEWHRLARSRQILGEREAARRVYERGLEETPDSALLLKGYAATLLGPPEPESGLPRIPEEATTLFERAAKLAPADPEPYWYLGIRALQEGRPEDARENWRAVLARLDPEHPEYGAIERRIEALGGTP